ncbi:MAG TPA: electron transfer flavoprotein subunit beta/FixA family protein [Armatimonadota bacterium]|nr:electron transfer flavoprotein subunit beta/FixA family protein [Armatimonadota bacterium]
MRIVACIKQVPDTTQVRIDPVTNTLIREGVPSIINPFDVPAIEEAMRLKERYDGAAVMLCMGPPWAEEALRKALSFGVDEAVLLSDRALAGSDTLATSAALAAAIRKLGEHQPVDLVICGKQTIDGDTAQVGPGIATRLGFAQLTYVDQVASVDLETRRIRVRRMLEGAREIVEAPLPALLTVVKEINQPRYATMPNLIRGLRAEIPVWRAQDIGVSADEVGLEGSPTQVRRIFPPPRRGAGEIIAGALEDPGRAAATVIDRLIAAGHIGDGSEASA